MAKLPPLPPGFEEVPDTSASSATNMPPVPEGFEAVPEAPPRHVPLEEYQDTVKRIIAEGGGAKAVNEYTKAAGRSTELTPKHKRLLKLADQGNTNFRWEVPDTMAMQAIEGVTRGLQHPLEAAAQLAMRGTEALGFAPKGTFDSAQEKLGTFTEQADANHIRGVAGNVAAFAGEVPAMAVLPMGAPVKAAQGAGLLATAAKQVFSRRAIPLTASGAAAGALAGGATKTSGEQDAKILFGAGTALLGVPLIEGLVTKYGLPAARAVYDRVANSGVGKTLFDASGALTPAGLNLRTRIKHASPGIDDRMVDDILLHIKKTNPKRLPDDAHIAPEMVSQMEGVPMIAPMKAKDAKGMQDFESAMAGVGPFNKVLGTQDKAVAADKAIDSAIIANVDSIKGSNATSDEAADATMNKIGVAAKVDQDAKNAAYEKVNTSKEKFLKPTQLIKLRNDFIDGEGQAAIDSYRTTEPKVSAYLAELSHMGRAKELRFGHLWGLVKRVREDAGRKDAGGPIKTLAAKINNFLDSAPPDMFASGSRGVFNDLRAADALNRTYKTKFSPRNLKSMTDVAGKRTEAIIGMYANPEHYSPTKVEQTIWGVAKGLGGKETQVTLQRLVKAAPGVQPHLREMGMNRLTDQITDTLSTAGGEKGLSPANAAKIITGAVNDNVGVLKAMGLSEAEISSLRNNGYLAASKINAIGARSKGSSATNRGAWKTDAKRILNKALWAGAPATATALHTGTAGVAALTVGLGVTGAVTGASLLAARNAAKKILSTKPLKATPKLTKNQAKLAAAVARTATGKLSDKLARDRGQ